MRLIARIVLLVFVLTMMLALASSVIVSADMPNPGDLKGQEQPINQDAKDGIVGITGSLLWYLQIIGSIAAVIILALYGVKWFLASPQQKAILKEQAWSYVIGAVLVFGGAQMMTWIATTFSDVFKG